MQRILASRSSIPFLNTHMLQPTPTILMLFHLFLQEIHFGTISIYKVFAEIAQRTAHKSRRQPIHVLSVVRCNGTNPGARKAPTCYLWSPSCSSFLDFHDFDIFEDVSQSFRRISLNLYLFDAFSCVASGYPCGAEIAEDLMLCSHCVPSGGVECRFD